MSAPLLNSASLKKALDKNKEIEKKKEEKYDPKKGTVTWKSLTAGTYKLDIPEGMTKKEYKKQQRKEAKELRKVIS